MSNPFNLIWTGPAGQLHGYDPVSGAWLDTLLTYGILSPGVAAALQMVTLTGSGLVGRTYETLTNVALYLDADEATLALLSGCISLSFDGGVTFQPLTATPVTLPAAATGTDGVEGQIGPYDVASFLVALVAPAGSAQAAPYTFRISVDCDPV